MASICGKAFDVVTVRLVGNCGSGVFFASISFYISADKRVSGDRSVCVSEFGAGAGCRVHGFGAGAGVLSCCVGGGFNAVRCSGADDFAPQFIPGAVLGVRE